MRESGLKLEKGKTKVMVIVENGENLNIEVDGDNSEQVNHLQYLGETIDDQGLQDAEISIGPKVKVFKIKYTAKSSFSAANTGSKQIDKKAISNRYLIFRGVSRRDRMKKCGYSKRATNRVHIKMHRRKEICLRK